MSPPKPTKNQQKVLNQFLRRHKANGALSLTETKGFLFMVACCPEMVMPSEWQSLVISEDVIFESEQEAQDVMSLLMAMYNQVNGQAFLNKPKLPPECRIAPKLWANFEPASKLYQWAKGFRLAADWLLDTWEVSLQQEDFELHIINAAILSTPYDRKGMFVFQVDTQDEEEQAKRALEAMPFAMAKLVQLGRHLNHEPAPSIH